ncbi:hypothetical protein TNIN_450851 [Trichonephila inaurata madagascariensis]|uniref:Uncharacterized protein n=1 Tax=Trichonephila inaurata madagascariensis TaxID=2747483 RepID=A0A8X6YCI9_9ARAC|nr:hypothetical protein TNIN_450851 [Trichonephila inaurata madagascariensis]
MYSFLKDHNTANIKTLSGLKAIVFVAVKTSSFASTEAAYHRKSLAVKEVFSTPAYCYRRFERLKNLTALLDLLPIGRRTLFA